MPTNFVEGMDLLLRKLKTLPRLVEEIIVDDALEKAAEVIKDSAKANVPVDTGNLRDAITVVRNKAIRARHLVNVRCWEGGADMGNASGLQFYGAFVEYGHFQGKREHRMRLVKRDVVYKGRKSMLVENEKYSAVEKRKFIPGRPFMRAAFDHNVDRAIEIISREIGAGIEREASK